MIFSTIAAPVIIQKTITTGLSAASQLLAGMFAAGRTAATTGATTLVNVGAGAAGMGGMIKAGVVSTSAAAESLGAAAVNQGYGGGSMIGSLSWMQGSSAGARRLAPASFPANDPTGDRTVAELIRQTRNSYSSPISAERRRNYASDHWRTGGGRAAG